jgi:hypothetical protein
VEERTMTPANKQMQRALNALYLEVSESVADDVAAKVGARITELEKSNDRMTGYKEAIEVLETKALVEFYMKDEHGVFRAMLYQLAAEYLRSVMPIVENEK